MPEQSPYFDSITANRSLLLDDETALEGNTLISAETVAEEMAGDDVYTYCLEHFADWLRHIRALSKDQQELLLAYYLLGKTQRVLAALDQSTQTICSFRLRMAIKIMGAFLLFGGLPSVEVMRTILLKNDLEHTLRVPLSELIRDYMKYRSFERVASRRNLHRPDVRRAMSHAAKTLLGGDPESEPLATGDQESQALGAVIFGLIDKSNPVGQGRSKRQVAKTTDWTVRKDSPVVGQFRVDCRDKGFDEMFVSRANR